jgi:hypothetical protein
MGKIGEAACLHGIHGLFAVPAENGFVHGRSTGIGASILISQEVLTQQQVFYPLIPGRSNQIRENCRIILHFQAHVDADLVTVPVSQIPDYLAVIGKFLGIHPDFGGITVPKKLGSVVGESQNVKSLFHCGFYIFLFRACCVIAPPGMAMIVCAHNSPPFSFIVSLLSLFVKF